MQPVALYALFITGGLIFITGFVFGFIFTCLIQAFSEKN